MITSKDTEKPDHIHNLFMVTTLKKKKTTMPLVSITLNGELYKAFPQFRNELWIPTIPLVFNVLLEVLASSKDKK